ncbi:helix-turn-helix domain-containing protein, partial [Vibrio anguillarum]|nr:XRE family transcriptional regulator [Vibrio anguillarum]
MKMNWTDLVKSRMKEIGITQDGLAENMGVSQASIARYLNKKR